MRPGPAGAPGRAAATLFTLLLGACVTTPWSAPARLAPCPGPIPSVAALPPGDFVWRERVRYRGHEVDTGFSLVVEKRGDRLVLVALNPFGAKVFSLTQIDTEVEVLSQLERFLQVPPENVLRDWHAVRANRTAQTGPVELRRPECGYTATFVAEDRRVLEAGGRSGDDELSASAFP